MMTMPCFVVAFIELALFLPIARGFPSPSFMSTIPILQRAKPDCIDLRRRVQDSCNSETFLQASSTYDCDEGDREDHRYLAPGFKRFACRVAYDGTGFRGFQIQKKPQKETKKIARTVQGELEKALSMIFQTQTTVVAASRTDTGVHARGQAFHFDVEENKCFSPDLICYKANQLLPDDVVVWNMSLAPATGTFGNLPWHANVAPTGKLYSYRFRTAKHMSPLDRRDRALWYKCELDIGLMRSCCLEFEGTHDFTSFGNRLAHKEADVGRELDCHRTIKSIELVDESHGNYRIDFVLDGALYKMVRNIVGILFGVSSGILPRETISEALLAKNRTKNPARAAPAEGLTLESVFYDCY